MDGLVEVQAVVRLAMLDRVIHALRDTGIPRLTVARVHAIGTGVDPTAAKLSVQEGVEYADKALVRFVCGSDQRGAAVDLVATTARTGRPGDGIVYVTPVQQVVKIRTGAAGLEALR